MSSDLFEFGEQQEIDVGPTSAPLAHRMRPRTLDEFVGQEAVLGVNQPLRRWIESDRVPSLILWGPPGCGKTTLSKIIAERTQCHFISLSAVLSGVKDVKEAVQAAKQSWALSRRKTILFIDEIHRFNRSQQDALLPHVEEGTITLIGATTENPSYELNAALLSRARTIRFVGITDLAIAQLLERALKDPKRGLGGFFTFTDEALQYLSNLAEGDARRALTALETVSLFVGQNQTGQTLNKDDVSCALESALVRQPIRYDKSGNEHYTIISAFIKGLRKGDPHAGLYYLARMLEGGEDPLFIARRLVIFASEDIGNADPRALQVAIACKEAVDFIGMPEGRINLAQAVTYLALAPKSNASYLGINQAMEEVIRSGALAVPVGSLAGQMPASLTKVKFYEPADSGLEKAFKERLALRD